MKRLFLHAGHFKTGTTSAQYALSENRDALREYGFLYPDYGGEYGHQHGNLLVLWNDQHRDENLKHWREKMPALRAAPEQTIILSAETVTSFSRENFTQFREVFHDFELILVFALRHWAGFCPSRLQEHIRWGDALSFPGFLERIAADFDVSVNGDFSLPMRRAAGIFDRIAPAPYSVAGGLPTLFRAFGFPDELIQRVGASKRENPSLSYIEREGGRLCNLVFNAHLGRNNDCDYAITIDAAPMTKGYWSPRRAFVNSDAPGAQELRDFVTETKLVTPKMHWAGLFGDWTRRLNASLESQGLAPMPDDWGLDELSGSVDYTTATRTDVPEACSRGFLDFVREMRLAKAASASSGT